MNLEIDQNRKAKKYPTNEQLLRLLWFFGKVMFQLSPRPFFAYRRFILRIFGAKIGKNVNIYPSSEIYFPWNLQIGSWSAIGENALIYNLGKVVIGNKVTISHKAHICAGSHDYCDPTLPLIKPKIVLQDQVWIAAEAFIAPGVTVGEGAVVGARSAVFRDVEPWTVVGGNPARFIKKRVINN